MMKRINHLYIHVPFCNAICNYCDFCHRIYQSKEVDKWLNTIKKEIETKCLDQYKTIYIGGGTPSCLKYDELETLLSYIKPFSNEVIEYTIEVNPESLDLDKVLLFKKYGINRISMGVQSSSNTLLKSLNRKHTFEDVKNKINILKTNGINNISIDLMYSLPSQNLDILNQTLNDFLSLDIPHVSLYSLTVEENSVFGKKGIRSLDEEIEADMYEMICNTLKQNGYIHYEVSNFCKEGYESKHNMAYWQYNDFLGVSLSASSKIGNIRYTNTRNFLDYFNDFNSHEEYLMLDKKEQMFEHIMMGLRTIYGIDIDDFNSRYNCDLLKEYKKGINNPNIEVKNNHVYCINLAILNNVLLDFMD